jgi:hypothetical protein
MRRVRQWEKVKIELKNQPPALVGGWFNELNFLDISKILFFILFLGFIFMYLAGVIFNYAFALAVAVAVAVPFASGAFLISS